MSRSPSHLRIGIVGAGNIGEPLARLWTEAGYTVKIANSRGPETLSEVAQRTGATAATVEDAVRDAQVIVVTIPQKAVPQLAEKKLFSQLPQDTIVIDTGNYYPYREGQMEEFDSESITESEWVAQQLGHSVIKAFNNIWSESLSKEGKPAGTAGRIALPIAGDSAAHKATVIALLDQIGFDGVDAGGLDESWRQQPGTPVYCCNYDAEGVKKALGAADRSRSHAMQGLQLQGMIAAFTAKKSPEEIINMSREFMQQHYGARYDK